MRPGRAADSGVLDVPVRERLGGGDRSRTRRGAGVVEALEPATGVWVARHALAVPPGGLRRRTAGETGKCGGVGTGPGTPVDAAADLDVIVEAGGLLATDRLVARTVERSMRI